MVTTFLLHFSFSFFSTVAFGILTNVPRKALPFCGFTGGIGWIAYWVLHTYFDVGLGFANFAGAFLIGILSVIFSRKIKMPIIIFNIPSLVPLVPGGAAYMAVREVFLGNYPLAAQNIMVVMITSGAIAGGFMMTSILEDLVRKNLSKKHKLKHFS